MKTLLLLLFGTAASFGSIQWENPSISFDAHPLQGVEKLVYRYVNTGKEPVSILDVKGSCGCLVPALDRTPVPPGGHGRLKVDFDLFNRTGRQVKKLTVKMSDGRTASLSVTAHIPRAYTVSPTLMKFSDGAPAFKTATLRSAGQVPLPISAVESSNKKVKAELTCINEGYEYAVTVTPSDSALTQRAVIRIIPEKPEGVAVVKTFKFYVVAGGHGSSGQR